MNLPGYEEWLEYKPYSLCENKKSALLTNMLSELTTFHAKRCSEYANIVGVLGGKVGGINKTEDVPYIPVRLFKEFDLLSIERDNIFKTMMSSGTSGQQVSRIYLDRETASLQTRILSRIMRDLLSEKRLPMLVIDTPSVLKDRQSFSARGAGILGFSMFGKDVTYALDQSMNLDVEAVEGFLKRHPDQPVFIFGFTFMIWQYFVLPLLENKLIFPLEQATVLHGGGWKKLQDQAVSNPEFKSIMKSVTGINKIVNYYGMVEQTGSLFMECEEGHLHAPIYADVIVRRTSDFSVADVGEEGVIEVLSILPRSYPGHALLTEDTGVLLGEDDCRCGRLGKYFQVHGRLAKAEVRGCSDTHEASI